MSEQSVAEAEQSPLTLGLALLSPLNGVAFRLPSRWLTYGDNSLSLSALAALTSTTTTEGSVVRTLKGRDMY